jgi:amino acid transporter
VHTHKARTVGSWARLKLVGAGLVLAGFGWALQLRGIQIVRHSNGQPMFSWGFIGAGLLCFVLALIPTAWVTKAAETPKARSGHKY